MKTSAILLATVLASASAFVPSQQKSARPHLGALEMVKGGKGSKRKAALKVSSPSSLLVGR